MADGSNKMVANQQSQQTDRAPAALDQSARGLLSHRVEETGGDEEEETPQEKKTDSERLKITRSGQRQPIITLRCQEIRDVLL